MEDALIVAVCGQSVLYDTTLVSYRDRIKKEQAWVVVGEETGIPDQLSGNESDPDDVPCCCCCYSCPCPCRWPCPKTTERRRNGPNTLNLACDPPERPSSVSQSPGPVDLQRS
ncbi:unnamed protein product [Gadus morhua 'NCC']